MTPAKKEFMSIRVERSFRDRIESLAQRERRTLTAQLCYLVEKGLTVIDQEAGTRKKRRTVPSNSRPLIDTLSVIEGDTQKNLV